MMAAAFGLVHAGLITGFDPSTRGAAAGLGLVIGLVHGVAVTLILPAMLTVAHPLVARATSRDQARCSPASGR